jgi:hypothetical protein
MNKKFPLMTVFGLVIVLGLLHFAGVYLYLYWREPGYDKIVHLVAGFLTAFTVMMVFYFRQLPDVSKSYLLMLSLLATLVIGITWELFELRAGITSLNDQHYWFDNAGDVVGGMIGGLIALMYVIKKYKKAALSVV